MVEVHLWSSLRRFTEDQEVVSVTARTVGEMLDALKRDFPGLAPILDAGVSVSVNGEMVPGRHVALPENAEIYLMQKLKGG